MKLILKTLFFHLVCIVLFGVIYSSTAIQSGTGFSQTVPDTTNAKLIVMLQEFLMISGTLISLHIFFNKDILRFT